MGKRWQVSDAQNAVLKKRLDVNPRSLQNVTARRHLKRKRHRNMLSAACASAEGSNTKGATK